MSTAAQVDPAVLEAMKAAKFADLHPALVTEAAAGRFTILDLLDTVPWFRTGADWTSWRAFLCALYGLPMTDEEFAIYCECTGRTDRPTEKSDEAWLICGRRARKSAIEAAIGVYEGGFFDYAPHMAPGERARIPVLAKSMEDAGQIMAYAKAMLADDALSYLLEEEPTGDTIKLRTRVDLIIRAATITAGRGKATPAALLDELAFFRSKDSAHPDVEIIRGIEPAMANMPRRTLIGASSPYARNGVLWEKYEEHYGKRGRILVWKAKTLRMNDTPLIRDFVAKKYEEDPISAAAEVGADFRRDIEEFVSVEAWDACRVVGRIRLEPKPKTRYFGFVDPSGGSSDHFTAAVAHWDGVYNEPLKGKAVLDDLKTVQPPFSPESAVKDICAFFAPYGITTVRGDAYAGEWPRERFQKNKPTGVAYVVADESKSEIYQAWLPDLNSGRMELLDIKRLRVQALLLERRVGAQGHEVITHPPGGKDDEVNAAAGALRLAATLGVHSKPPKEEPPKPKNTVEQFEKQIQEEMKARHRSGTSKPRRFKGRNW